MFQKLTPLIILLLFAIGTYFMISKMNSATKIAIPKVEQTK